MYGTAASYKQGYSARRLGWEFWSVAAKNGGRRWSGRQSKRALVMGGFGKDLPPGHLSTGIHSMGGFPQSLVVSLFYSTAGSLNITLLL